MKTIILLPGALGSAEQFIPLQNLLQNKPIETVALDLPHHGKSEISLANNSVPAMAEALLTQMDKLNLNGTLSIFGHSLGGYIGLYLCLNYPNRIEKLFTLGTKWQWNHQITEQETKLLNPAIMEQKIPTYVELLKKTHSRNWEFVVKTIADLMRDLGENQYLNPENLGTIHSKIRIAQGDRDNMVNLEESIACFRALSNAQFQVFPNTKHPYEKISVELLADEIELFLE